MPQDSKPQWHEHLNLKATNLQGFYTRSRPKDGFNPLTASADELAKHGLPPRPEQKSDPQAHLRWSSLYGRALNFIAPELVVRPRQAHGPRKHRQAAAENDPISFQSDSNWAGTAFQANAGQTFTQVVGSWTVPGVSPPAFGPYAGAGNWQSVAWVGLDGFQNSDVFQAGTAQNLSTFFFITEASYFAWTEWFPAPPVAITNFPVSPGDFVTFDLTILSLAVDFFGVSVPTGQALVINATKGNFTIVAMAGPLNGQPDSFQGSSAEWIVETPGFGSGASLTFAPLPYFGQVAFSNGIAFDSTGAGVFGANGIALSMQNSGAGVGRTGTSSGATVATELADPVIFGVLAVNGG